MHEASFSPEAEAEIGEAYRWYERQSPGLGAEFVRAVDMRIGEICREPNRFPVIHKHVRRALLRRFPYGLFYVVQDADVRIIACFHERRNPGTWRSRGPSH